MCETQGDYLVQINATRYSNQQVMVRASLISGRILFEEEFANNVRLDEVSNRMKKKINVPEGAELKLLDVNVPEGAKLKEKRFLDLWRSVESLVVRVLNNAHFIFR